MKLQEKKNVTFYRLKRLTSEQMQINPWSLKIVWGLNNDVWMWSIHVWFSDSCVVAGTTLVMLELYKKTPQNRLFMAWKERKPSRVQDDAAKIKSCFSSHSICSSCINPIKQNFSVFSAVIFRQYFRALQKMEEKMSNIWINRWSKERTTNHSLEYTSA